MKKQYYVYVHYRKDNGFPFYVGKGKAYRAKESTKRTDEWKAIANQYGWFHKLVEENLTESEAFEKERYYIKLIGRENLCNKTDGGHGNLGAKFTDEHKENLRKSNVGKKHAPLTALTKQRMSEAKKGKLPNNIRKVINNDTGEIYDCAQDVAKLLGIPYGTLNNYLLGRRKNKTPYTYLHMEH